MLAVSLIALAVAGAWAQPPTPQKSDAPEIRPTTLRLPDLDKGETVTVIGMVPIPNVGEGAPLFTAQDLTKMEGEARKAMTDTRRDVFRCSGRSTGATFNPAEPPSLPNLLAQEFEAESRVAAATSKARQVTEQAEAARRDAAAGKADTKVVESTELDRQTAVMVLQKARGNLVEAQAMIGDFQNMKLGEQGKFGIEWGDLEMRALNRQREGVGLGVALPEDLKTLAIQNVQASQHKDKKGKDIVVVRGEILNSGKKSAPVPSLSVALVDERGWVMFTQTVEATGPLWQNLPAGKSKAFAVEVRQAPDLLQTAVVSFAAKHAAEPRLGVSVFCGGALNR